MHKGYEKQKGIWYNPFLEMIKFKLQFLKLDKSKAKAKYGTRWNSPRIFHDIAFSCVAVRYHKTHISADAAKSERCKKSQGQFDVFEMYAMLRWQNTEMN